MISHPAFTRCRDSKASTEVSSAQHATLLATRDTWWPLSSAPGLLSPSGKEGEQQAPVPHDRLR